MPKTSTLKRSVKPKCVHGKCCNGYYCRQCLASGENGRGLCVHGLAKASCGVVTCGGGKSLCSHNILRTLCKVEACGGGGSYCVHNTLRCKCKVDGCGGNSLCVHKRIRAMCRVSSCGGGTGYCKHNRVRTMCGSPECGGGGGLCSHGTIRSLCKIKDCVGGGKSYCIHGSLRSVCKVPLCGGGSYCEHGSLRSVCRSSECKGGGGSFCRHRVIRGVCKECVTMTRLIANPYICNACLSVSLGRNRRLTSGLCAGCDKTRLATTEQIVRQHTLPFLPPASAIDSVLIGGRNCGEDRRRPDMAWVGLDRIIMLEVDEHSHVDRDSTCETAKLDATRWGLNTGFTHENYIPVITVRMNPDECDSTPSAPSFVDRCNRVVEVLKYYITCPLTAIDPLRSNVHYMFYHSKATKHIDAARASVDNIRVLAVE